MKDYELDKKKKGLFILNYEVKGNKIIVNYANGDAVSIPNSLENVDILDRSMKEQVNNSDNFFKKCEITFSISSIASILAFIVSLLSIGVLYFNPNVYALFYQVALCLGMGVTLVSGSAAVINLNKIKDVIKNKEFLEIESTLNAKVKENENMLYNTHKVTKNVVKRSNENRITFTINNIDKVPFSDLEQIVSNIEREEKFNFEYPEIVEEKVKSKTK